MQLDQYAPVLAMDPFYRDRKGLIFHHVDPFQPAGAHCRRGVILDMDLVQGALGPEDRYCKTCARGWHPSPVRLGSGE